MEDLAATRSSACYWVSRKHLLLGDRQNSRLVHGLAKRQDMLHFEIGQFTHANCDGRKPELDGKFGIQQLCTQLIRVSR